MLNHNSKGDLESINTFRAQNRWRSPRVSSGTMKMGMATCVYEDLVRGCKRYIVCYVRIEIQMGGAVVMPWWFQRFFRPRLAQNALQTKDTKAKKDAEGWDCIFQTRGTNTKKKKAFEKNTKHPWAYRHACMPIGCGDPGRQFDLCSAHMSRLFICFACMACAMAKKKSLPIRSKLQSLVERCMLRNLEILMVSKISQLLTMTFFRILSQFFNLMSFRSFQ